MKKIATGLIGAALLMALSTTAVHAAAPILLCKSGDVLATGTGNILGYDGGKDVYSSKRTVTLKCDVPLSGSDLIGTGSLPGDWVDITDGAMYSVRGDKDGVLAVALTALADDKKVSYMVEPRHQKKKVDGVYQYMITGDIKGIQVLQDAPGG